MNDIPKEDTFMAANYARFSKKNSIEWGKVEDDKILPLDCGDYTTKDFLEYIKKKEKTPNKNRFTSGMFPFYPRSPHLAKFFAKVPITDNIRSNQGSILTIRRTIYSSQNRTRPFLLRWERSFVLLT